MLKSLNTIEMIIIQSIWYAQVKINNMIWVSNKLPSQSEPLEITLILANIINITV